VRVLRDGKISWDPQLQVPRNPPTPTIKSTLACCLQKQKPKEKDPHQRGPVTRRRQQGGTAAKLAASTLGIWELYSLPVLE